MARNFRLKDLFNMDANDKSTTTQNEDEKPLWSDEAIKKPNKSAFDRLPKGEDYPEDEF